MADTPQLTPQQLASQIRSKYPGAYDKVDDTKLVTAVTEKFPVYNQYLVPPANFETPLNSQEEKTFQGWKKQYAPNDSGQDYDLRGAFKAGLKPDPKTGHWPDTFKKPNEPTFSDESFYARFAPDKAGHWEGPNHDTFVPPAKKQGGSTLPAGPPPSGFQKWLQTDPLSQALGVAQKGLEASEKPAQYVAKQYDTAQDKLQDLISTKLAGHPVAAGLTSAYVQPVLTASKMATTALADPKNAPFFAEEAMAAGVRPLVKMLTAGTFATTQGKDAYDALKQGRYADAAQAAAFSLLGLTGLKGHEGAPGVPPEAAPHPSQTAVASTPGVQTPPTRTFGANRYTMTPDGWKLAPETAPPAAAPTPTHLDPKVSAQAAGPAIQTPEHIIKAAGATYNGEMEHLTLFTDPVTGSTVSLPTTGVSEGAVRAALDSKRQEFEKAGKQLDTASPQPTAAKPAQQVVQTPALKGPEGVPPPVLSAFDKRDALNTELESTSDPARKATLTRQIQDTTRSIEAASVQEKLAAPLPKAEPSKATPAELSFAGTKPIADFLKAKTEASKGAFGNFLQHLRSVASPLSNVDFETRNLFTERLVGKPAQLNASIDHLTQDAWKHINSLPDDQKIALVDNIMQGKGALHPDNPIEQGFVKMFRTIDDAQYEGLLKHYPNLPRVENHFALTFAERLLPDGTKDLGFYGLGEGGQGRRPLSGSKSFAKARTFDTLSEAMAPDEFGRKLIPLSLNAVDLAKARWHDNYKLINAKEVWNQLKDDGKLHYIENGKVDPPGWKVVNDSMAHLMAPIGEHGKLFAEVGHYAMEPGAADILNNYLSKDYFRNNPITKTLGQSLMEIKNAQTRIELIGPYHIWTTTNNAIGSHIANSFAQMYEVGWRQKSPKDFALGAQDLLGSAAAPFKYYREGKHLYQAGVSKNDFFESPEHKDLIAKDPEIAHFVDMLVKGGAQLRAPEDFRIKSAQWLDLARRRPPTDFKLGEAGKAASVGYYTGLRGIQDGFKFMMDKMVPRIKLGAMAHDFYVQRKRYGPDLASGKVSEESIARESNDRINNMFGQNDFAARFWNNTLKAIGQFNFLSMGWRLGDIDMGVRAIVGQTNALKDMSTHIGKLITGKIPVSKGSVLHSFPSLDPNFAYLAGITAVALGEGALLTKTLTGKWPTDLFDALHPLSGQKDSRGMPVRLTTPSYGSKDILEVFDRLALKHLPFYQRLQPTGTVGYITGGESTFFSRLKEVRNNQDYNGVMVYNPHAPWPLQLIQQAGHVFNPNPIAISSAAKLSESMGSTTTSLLQHGKNLLHGAPEESKALAMSLAGISLAPKRQDLSLAAREALDAEIRGLPRGPKSTEEGAILDNTRLLHTLIANKSPYLGDFVRQSMQQGLLTPKEFQRAVKEQYTLNYFQRLVSHLRGPRMSNDLLSVMDLATKDEKQQAFPIVAHKILNDLPKMTSEQRAITLQKLRGYQNEIKGLPENPLGREDNRNLLNLLTSPDPSERLDPRVSDALTGN